MILAPSGEFLIIYSFYFYQYTMTSNHFLILFSVLLVFACAINHRLYIIDGCEPYGRVP